MTFDTDQTGGQPAAPKTVSISVETVIYALITIAAAAIRWISLGVAPLSAVEAPQALAAWHLVAPDIASGTGAISSILVFAGTALSFAVSGPDTAAARFAPALAGMLLVLSPLLFRHRLGGIGTVLCMLFLAVSPAAVMASRQMTGVGMAMVGILAMLAAVDRYLSTSHRTYAILAGIGLAVALLADFGTLAVVVMLLAGGALAILTDEDEEISQESIAELAGTFPWTAALIGLGTTIALLGTLFYFAPTGLTAAADQIARFFGGLVSRPANTPYLGLVIFAYEPFLLLIGMIAAWSASQAAQAWQRFLAGWAIAAVIISLAYPGALPAHSLWAVVPMAALAAIFLAQLVEPASRAAMLAIAAYGAGTVALIAMFVGALGRQLSSPQLFPDGPFNLIISYDPLIMLMAVMLAAIFWLTIASMWGRLTAWRGLVLGAAVAGLVASIGLASAAAFTRPTSPYELFNTWPADPGLPALVQTAEDVSRIGATDIHDASVTVLGDPNTALAWSLRDFHNVTYVTTLPANTQSIMVITSVDSTNPGLGSNYVGQSFIITRQWTFADLDAPHLLSWLIYHSGDDASLSQQRVILWVREDFYQLVPKGNTP